MNFTIYTAKNDKQKMMDLNLVIERGDDEEIAGSLETPDFFFSTVGMTESEIISDLRSQITNYLMHEGKELPQWQGIDPNQIQFNIEYDLTALFEVFSAIKISSIADLAGINQGLLRQYASGVKSASAQQAKKVETALRQLGERLMRVTVA